MPGPLRVFFSAGEPSGDEHAAGLLRALKELGPVEAHGLGGTGLRRAGCHLLADMGPLAVMWFAQALRRLPQFYRLLRQVRRHLHHWRPDAVVLVDYPGFNWHVAQAARELGIPVFYFCPPQVWAWARWRVRRMRRLVDLVLCSLPFEHQWYSQQGCHAQWVGHPYFDHVHQARTDRQTVLRLQASGPVLALLPGSRLQEVRQNFPWIVETARRVKSHCPEVQLVVGAYGPEHARLARQHLDRCGLEVHVLQGQTLALIQAARAALAVSGSVSLELMYYQVPTVILYRVNPLAWYVQHLVKRVRYITLVNLLAAEEPFTRGPFTYHPDRPGAAPVPFPEYLVWRNPAPRAAAWLVQWLAQPDAHARQTAWLAELKRRYGQPGACRRAARAICTHLGLIPRKRNPAAA